MQKINPMQKQPKNEVLMSESHIQQQIVRWYRNTYCLKHHTPRCLIFSVPNESNGVRAMKLIQTGLYPGCADLVICHSPNRPDNTNIWLFIEIKTATGTQSPKQKQFEQHCNQMGLRYELVRSLQDFIEVIKNL